MSALADTSLFIAREQRRPLGSVPGGLCVCVVTIAELALGVVQADRVETRSRRLATLSYVQSTFEPLPINEDVAHAWAGLVGALRSTGRRAPVNDTWIAAVAIARNLPVVTQDDDYDGMPGLDVIRV